MKAWEDADARIRQILSGITFVELVGRAREEDALTNHVWRRRRNVSLVVIVHTLGSVFGEN